MASEVDGVASRLSEGRTSQGAPTKVARAALTQAEANAEHLAPKRGRPRIHPDRKAYKAAEERKRRARLKAEKEGK